MGTKPTVFIGIGQGCDLGLSQRGHLLLIKRERPGIQSEGDITVDLGVYTPALNQNLKNYLDQLLMMTS